jgi:hypothetical protein
MGVPFLIIRTIDLNSYYSYLQFYFACCFCGCETRFLILREEHRLRVYENSVLRKIFGSKKDEITWDWRSRHNDMIFNQEE